MSNINQLIRAEKTARVSSALAWSSLCAKQKSRNSGLGDTQSCTTFFLAPNFAALKICIDAEAVKKARIRKSGEAETERLVNFRGAPTTNSQVLGRTSLQRVLDTFAAKSVRRKNI